MTLHTYQGSRLLLFATNAIGLPIDQLNFLVTQLVALLAGLAFRAYLKPCPQNTLRRHVVSILLGIVLGHFCFGPQMWHLFFQSFVCYVALIFCPRQYVQYVIFVFSMGYLSGVHIYRQIYDYGNYTLDISGSLMVASQKLTYLAFAYYDGIRPVDKLNADQKSQAMKDCPNLIEFLSYMFNFQGVIVGPLCYYQDYIDFINGNSILKEKNRNPKELEEDGPAIIVQPSVLVPMLQKFAMFLVLGLIFFNVTTTYNVNYTLTPEMAEKPLWSRFIWFYICVSSQRAKYYLAWVLADLVNNASGFGFNGYDSKGNAKWDLVTNVNIFKLETATSVKSAFDNWNIQTALWLRRVAYDRLPHQKTLGVFTLSAFWHGFYPGYYLAFFLCALMVNAGRVLRRKVRPYMLQNPILSAIYSVLGWVFSLYGLNYMACSFDLLEFWKGINFFTWWYWCVHIFSIGAPLLLQFLPTKHLDSDKRKPKKVETIEEKTPVLEEKKTE